METMITIDGRRYMSFQRALDGIELVPLADDDIPLHLSIADFECLYARARLSFVGQLQPLGLRGRR